MECDARVFYKRTRKVKTKLWWRCQDQCRSHGNHYFENQVLYRCIDTVVTQSTTRFVGQVKYLSDLYSCILWLTVISDDEISDSAKKLANEFQDFNPAEISTQIESFKYLFVFEFKSCNSIFDMTKLLIIENNNLLLVSHTC